MPKPKNPKIYHIVHVDRLPSIIADGHLLCDAEIARRSPKGPIIGMKSIKQRRIGINLNCYPDLYVGNCVPFYFCPRSIMLFVIYKANHPDLNYKGGQGPIVHLECDLLNTVTWAKGKGLRWAFTLSNAGSNFFEDRSKLSQLKEINWDAVQTDDWQLCTDGKQAEFLIEHNFPWELVTRIGVLSQQVCTKAETAIQNANHKPIVDIIHNWYY